MRWYYPTQSANLTAAGQSMGRNCFNGSTSSCWTVTHLRIYLTPTCEPVSDESFLRLSRLLDTLHCQADGKENKQTWEKWCQDTRVCLSDIWGWVSLRSEDACWCSSYCADPPAPIVHMHTYIHTSTQSVSITSEDIKMMTQCKHNPYLSNPIPCVNINLNLTIN